MSAEENLQRMKTFDDAWNAQNWEVFGSGIRPTPPCIGPDSPIPLADASATRLNPRPSSKQSKTRPSH
jgi:hypothetical protein